MTDTKQAANEQATQNFTVANIYVKDTSFEAPNSPHIFSEEWKPKVDFDIQMSSEPLGDDLYESVLNVTVTTKVPTKVDETKVEDKTAFLVEVHQAGIFTISGFSEQEVEQILATSAQEILFPYARELVSSMVMRGGFPQMLLPPVNFNALYQEHKNKAAEPATA